MPSSFVFLEIKDAPAASLLSDLRSVFKRKESRSPIHITVRGPYKTTPTRDKLEHLWHVIEGEGLLLSGIGRFQLPDRGLVILRSHSKAIRKIWWKRDYHIIRYGFNPHVTLFEGPHDRAIEVEKFLRKERLELFCRKLSLTLYETRDDELFSEPTRTELFSTNTASVSPLINPYRWTPGLVDRARELTSRWTSDDVTL